MSKTETNNEIVMEATEVTEVTEEKTGLFERVKSGIKKHKKAVIAVVATTVVGALGYVLIKKSGSSDIVADAVDAIDVETLECDTIE